MGATTTGTPRKWHAAKSFGSHPGEPIRDEHTSNALGMAGRIGQRAQRAKLNSAQRKLGDTGALNHRFYVQDVSIERLWVNAV